MSSSEFLTEKQTLKTLSFFLRHEIFRDGEAPSHDKFGFVNLDNLLNYMKSHNGKKIEKKLISKALKNDERNKFSIFGDNIRANYGHSGEVEDYYASNEKKEMPNHLFTVIKSSTEKEIKKGGFFKSNRDKQFLYESIEKAYFGKKDRPNLVVLKLDTNKMSKELKESFSSNDLDVWQTSNPISIDCIEFEAVKNKIKPKL